MLFLSKAVARIRSHLTDFPLMRFAPQAREGSGGGREQHVVSGNARMIQDDMNCPIECVDNRGILIPIFNQLYSDNIIQSIRSGTYESYEACELDSLIQSGEVILEIGAGCGFISSYCAKNPNTQAVFCIEANPALIPVIRFTHKINDIHAVLFHEILSPEEGESDFYLHEQFWASGTHGIGKKIKVKTTLFQKRLDEIRPTMLIIDIEGGEESLFENVDLTGVNKIMLEIHPLIIGRKGVKKLFDLLSAQNFHYDMCHSSHGVVTFSHVDRI